MPKMSFVTVAFGVCAVAAGAFGLPSGLHAHKGATGIVKERMDAMEMIGKDTKALGRMFQGKAPYDATMVKTLAERIAGHAGARMDRLFPEGTNDDPSEAKDEIWSDWELFQEISLDLEMTAGMLASTAAEGMDAAKAPFIEMAGTCKACHKRYRED